MRLQVFHRTRYRYRLSVQNSYNEVRLHPATQNKTRLEFFLLQVQPPVRLQHFRDDHLNYVHFFEIDEPHQELTIEAQFTINTTSPYTDGMPTGVGLTAFKDLQDEMLHAFLQPSRYVETSPEIWRLALDITSEATEVFAAARTHHAATSIENWTYAPNTTTASTHVSEVLESKRGVCQDFAHLMIALCRAIGIPARYVSGYLYNATDSNFRGAQASHAWCEVFIPGHGWYGLDPTNNTWAAGNHIKIATGRDYNDAAPVTGRFDGSVGVGTLLEVELRVEPA